MDSKDSGEQIIKPSNNSEGSSPPDEPQAANSAQSTSSPPEDLENQQPEQAPATTPSQETPSSGSGYPVPPSSYKPKKRWLKRLVALLVVGLLIFLGWLLYQEINKQQEDSAAPAAQNKDIDLLKVGIVSPDYGSLYPKMNLNSYGYLTNAQIFEGLVRYEEKSKIVPLLATDWSNPDNKTWVFNLKENVKFHTGNTMTAKDVKYSIDTIKSGNTDFSEVFASTIESVEAVGNNQVKITTTTPDPTLLNRLTFLYVIDSSAPKDVEPSMAGTGPYMIKPGTTPTNTNVQMVAYNGYHGAAPSTKAVDFGGEKTAEELIKAFEDGKYNIVGEVPFDQADKATNAYKLVSSEPEVAFLGLNSIKQGPLSSKKVREAIRYAVDPVILGKAKGDEAVPISQLIPESIPGHNPAIDNYERNIARARQLLKEAGYPNGLTLTLTLASEPEFAEELKKQLKEANINLKIDNREDFNEFIDFFSSGQAEMFYVIYTSDILDGLDIYETTLTSTGNYKNAELEKVLEKAASTVDPAERLKLLQDAAVIIDEDVAVIPLSTQDNSWLMDKDYDIAQDMPNAFLSVYFAKTKLK